MPTTQALQVFYGTLLLILVLCGIYFRKQVLLKNILTRLGEVEKSMKKIAERSIVLENRVE